MGDGFGDGFPTDGEVPVHRVRIDDFEMDTTTVTVADFAAFVTDTGYRTTAQQAGTSAVFTALVDDASAISGSVPAAPWWSIVSGADWAHPFGPDSGTDEQTDHPVVHVSWHDAQAYCRWAGRSLPSEAQWEFAARGGHAGRRYPWGDSARDRATCNIFVGEFPDHPAGSIGTVAVESYEPNDFGLWQMVGNVWEWCEDRFDPRYYARGESLNPRGPERGSARVLRGGSYLCHDSYCNRYRNAARSHNPPASTAGNVGFRTVRER